MTPTSPSSALVLTSEAARILGVSAQSVRQWERSGRLRATKTASGMRLFARSDVEEMRRALDQLHQTVEPTPGGKGTTE